MIFGCDVDGVLADFTRAFASEANKIWPERVPPDFEPRGWDFDGSGLTKEDVSLVWSKIKEHSNFWIDELPYPENCAALRRFRRNHPEAQVVYLTSRVPTAGLPVPHQTYAWLEREHLLGPGTAVFVKPNCISKCDVYKALGVPISIDDYLGNMAVCEGHTTVLLDRPWNRTGRESTYPAVSTLEEFFEMLA